MSKVSLAKALKNFQTAKNGVFVQKPPQIYPPFQHDSFVQKLLKRKIENETSYKEISNDLNSFSERIVSEIHELGRQNENSTPKLIKYNAWGERIDKLDLHPAWNKLKSISAEEGLIAISYERKHGIHSRLHATTKLAYFHPHSGLFSCPLAMTDGAASVIELFGKDLEIDDAFAHLTSRKPEYFWTSGQWMTEKRGGSDVGGGTDTMAIKDPIDPTKAKLHGYKWFASATDSEMNLTLARGADDNGDLINGTKGLTMYYVKVHEDKEKTKLNNVQILNLKNKLGTNGLPSAELLLEGTEATQIGESGKGVKNIANMLHTY